MSVANNEERSDAVDKQNALDAWNKVALLATQRLFPEVKSIEFVVDFKEELTEEEIRDASLWHSEGAELFIPTCTSDVEGVSVCC